MTNTLQNNSTTKSPLMNVLLALATGAALATACGPMEDGEVLDGAEDGLEEAALTDEEAALEGASAMRPVQLKIARPECSDNLASSAYQCSGAWKGLGATNVWYAYDHLPENHGVTTIELVNRSGSNIARHVDYVVVRTLQAHKLTILTSVSAKGEDDFNVAKEVVTSFGNDTDYTVAVGVANVRRVRIIVHNFANAYVGATMATVYGHR